MWRGYSAKFQGVKIETTIAGLLQSLCTQVASYTELSCFIGRVKYFSRNKIATALHDVDILDPLGLGIVKTLLLKRWAFRSESEIRLIYFNHDSPHRTFFEYDLEPNIVFEEVVIDPRMDKSDVEQWKARFKKSGFAGKIFQSGLYKPPDDFVINL